MKILMVLTSHDKLGNTGRKTGFWLGELAAPYFVFKDAGAEIVLASPKRGRPPLDPKSNEPSFQGDLTHRFEADTAARGQLASTVRLDSVGQVCYDTAASGEPFHDAGDVRRMDRLSKKNQTSTCSHPIRRGSG